MQNIDTFSDWDIATMEDWNGETWHIADQEHYPRLGNPITEVPVLRRITLAGYKPSKLTGEDRRRQEMG